MMRAFTFPGQGSQFVGMGADLAAAFTEARDVLEEVDEALGQNLSRLMREGPESDLNMTENTQPALMAVSLAVCRVVEKQGGFDLPRICRFVAGHSLGEYSALTAAGALGLSDCARLLKIRGQAMQRAVTPGAGAMAALLGLELPAAQEAARAGAALGVCETANDNSPGQIVISGARPAVEAAIEAASRLGAKKAVLLPVSAPFHCSLMAPAAEAMRKALAEVRWNTPCVLVVSNVLAESVQDPAQIRELLVQQITGMVRWRESVLWMRSQGVEELIELGAGKVLTGLARRIDKDIQALSVGTPQDIESLIRTLSLSK